MEEVLKYDLMNYYENKLKPRTKFFKRVSSESIMRWSSEVLTDPLTNLPTNLEDFAIQLFKSMYHLISRPIKLYAG
jgi:hypothetical protein